MKSEPLLRVNGDHKRAPKSGKMRVKSGAKTAIHPGGVSHHCGNE